MYVNLLIVGKTGVGKTRFRLASVGQGGSRKASKPTIGVDYSTTKLSPAATSSKVDLTLIEVSGNPLYRHLLPLYSQITDICVLLFDLKKHDTLDDLIDLAKVVQSNSKREIPFVLYGIGNREEGELDQGALKLLEQVEGFVDRADFVVGPTFDHVESAMSEIIWKHIKDGTIVASDRKTMVQTEVSEEEDAREKLLGTLKDWFQSTRRQNKE